MHQQRSSAVYSRLASCQVTLAQMQVRRISPPFGAMNGVAINGWTSQGRATAARGLCIRRGSSAISQEEAVTHRRSYGHSAVVTVAKDSCDFLPNQGRVRTGTTPHILPNSSGGYVTLGRHRTCPNVLPRLHRSGVCWRLCGVCTEMPTGVKQRHSLTYTKCPLPWSRNLTV